MRKGQKGKARSGGGIRSNKVVHHGIRTANRRTDVVSPSAVADLGASISYQRLPLIKSTAKEAVPMGNELVNNVGAGGPGKGRTIYPCGYQDQHGAAAKGEGGMQGKADRGSRAILGPPANRGAVRRGEQQGE
jgi:hypothetical protein